VPAQHELEQKLYQLLLQNPGTVFLALDRSKEIKQSPP
jgi:hypothetical protein